MEFKPTTMASSNNSSSPNGHSGSSGSGPAANHQHQSQHITTMSSPQGECWNVNRSPELLLPQWRLTLAGLAVGGSGYSPEWDIPNISTQAVHNIQRNQVWCYLASENHQLQFSPAHVRKSHILKYKDQFCSSGRFVLLGNKEVISKADSSSRWTRTNPAQRCPKSSQTKKSHLCEVDREPPKHSRPFHGCCSCCWCEKMFELLTFVSLHLQTPTLAGDVRAKQVPGFYSL